MKKNIGSGDRIVRLIVALSVVVLYYYKIIDGTLALILGVLAFLFLLTGLISFCPLYKIMGIRTREIESNE